MPAQDFVITTADELAQRIDGAAARFTDLVRSLTDDVSAGDWGRADVVAHVLTVVNRYVDFSPDRLAADPRGVDTINRKELDELAGVAVDELLAKLDSEMEHFRERWGPGAGIPLDAPLPFHGGATIDFQSAMTNLMGEYLIHGLDLARSAQRDWPIEPRDSALLCAFLTQLLPAYIRGSNRHVLRLRFELDGVAPFTVDIEGPVLVVRLESDGEPDVVIEGAASGLALLLYGRASVGELEHIGLRVVGGQRPELLSVWNELIEEP